MHHEYCIRAALVITYYSNGGLVIFPWSAAESRCNEVSRTDHVYRRAKPRAQHAAPTRRTAVSVRQALNTSLCRWYHYLGVPKRGEAPACSWTVREGTLSMYSTVLDRGLPFHEPPLLTQRTPPTTGRRGSSGDTPGGIYFFCIERFMSAQKGVTVIFQI